MIKGKRQISKIIIYIFRNAVEYVENLTNFKPFTIDEFISTKIDIISKLDEIAPSKIFFENNYFSV